MRKSVNTVYWGALVIGAFQHLQDPDLRGSDYKVFFLLCSEMKTDDNTAYIRQKEIGEKLSMDKGNVSKSIKRLCDKQFIVKHKNGFMINPHLFYTGRFSSHLRDNFDSILSQRGLNPKFYLNIDDRMLEHDDDY